MNLKAIKTIRKTGKEQFTINDEALSFSLLDFWKWNLSEIMGNAARGKLAEFIVGTAIGIGHENVREEWDAFDLQTKEGIKIEVKSAAYIQSWGQTNYSKISFSIKPTRAWDSNTKKRAIKAKRQADIYIFCLLKHKDQGTVNPLKLEQWEFYVLPTKTLNEILPTQTRISLNPLRNLTKAVSYMELLNAIKIASNER